MKIFSNGWNDIFLVKIWPLITDYSPLLPSPSRLILSSLGNQQCHFDYFLPPSPSPSLSPLPPPLWFLCHWRPPFSSREAQDLPPYWPAWPREALAGAAKCLLHSQRLTHIDWPAEDRNSWPDPGPAPSPDQVTLWLPPDSMRRRVGSVPLSPDVFQPHDLQADPLKKNSKSLYASPRCIPHNNFQECPVKIHIQKNLNAADRGISWLKWARFTSLSQKANISERFGCCTDLRLPRERQVGICFIFAYLNGFM